jgi:hypothetical protein
LVPFLILLAGDGQTVIFAEVGRISKGKAGSGSVLICFFLAAVLLIGIGPKSLEAQNEAAHPIGFIRRYEQPHPSVANEIHILGLVVFTGVNRRLIVKT